MNDSKTIIEDTLRKTLQRVQHAYNGDYAATETYVVFPNISNKKDEYRVSEQEFRFAFIEALIEHNKKAEESDKIHYSVETPTKAKYRFPKDDLPKIVEKNEEQSSEGQSASFDLTLYRNKKIIALIEFKAHNVNKLHVWKDLLKLQNPKEGDEGCYRYFLWLFKSKNSGTEKSVREKITEARSNLPQIDIKDFNRINCRCYVLSDKEPEEFYRHPENHPESTSSL
jgi:hypothetical protein